MTAWFLILAIGAATFSIRASLILTAGRLTIPPRLEGSLRHVPSAVLTALILPQFVVHEGALVLSPDNYRLVAGIVAAFVAGWTRNMIGTIAVGMGVLWPLQ